MNSPLCRKVNDPNHRAIVGFWSDDQCRICWLFNNPQITQAPSFFRKVINYGKAQIQHTLAGRQILSPEETQKRLDVCENCPSNRFDKLRRLCLHPSCGCNLDVKASWREQDCPMKHWPEIEET